MRIASNEVSFSTSAAWDDIYSNRGGSPAFRKSEVWHSPTRGFPASVLFTIEPKEHSRMRRAMGPGFTERAVLEQELIVQHYADLFVQRLRERISAASDKATTVNIVEWFNFLLFDITGDEEVQYHE